MPRSDDSLASSADRRSDLSVLDDPPASTDVDDTDPFPDTLILPPAELPGVEIDVEEVVRELRPVDVHRQERQFGIDHPVLRIASSARLKTVPCPVCDGETAVPRFALTRSRFRLVECEGCGLGSLHPRPDANEIAAFYPPSYYGSSGAKFVPGVERLVRILGNRQAKFLSRGLPSGGSVLDVGCGRGYLLQAMANEGLETHGFEVSDTAAAGLDPRVQLRVGNSLMDADYPDGRFDLIVLWHVFEHLPNPRETLEEIRRILKPGGRVAIAVPNFASLQARIFGPAWFHLDLPRHLYHFTPQGLRRMATDAGLQVENERHFSLRQNPFGWLQSALNALDPNHRNALYTLLKRTRNGELGTLQRVLNKSAYWLGMPVAAALSVVAALFRTGGTICLAARAPVSEPEARQQRERTATLRSAGVEM